MLVGSNPEEAHPVVGMQIRQAVQRGCKLIVVDPRDIDLAKKADIHLKLRPGTNVAFANGIMHVIIEEGLQDSDQHLYSCISFRVIYKFNKADAGFKILHRLY